MANMVTEARHLPAAEFNRCGDGDAKYNLRVPRRMMVMGQRGWVPFGDHFLFLLDPISAW